jgi:hypothetical protein
MPCLGDERLVLDDYPSNLVEFARPEAAVPGQNQWPEPELRLASIAPDVHVDRLGTIETANRSGFGTAPWRLLGL